MSDQRGQKLSFMKMWLDHVGDEAFNLAAEPKPVDFEQMSIPILTRPPERIQRRFEYVGICAFHRGRTGVWSRRSKWPLI